jgi:hypothetical protein
MPVGATIAAVGGAASAGIGALGAKSAAKTQAKAAQQASDVQLQMFGQTRADLAPFRSYGEGALSPLAKLLGYGDSGAGFDTGAYLTQNQDVAQSYQQLASTADGMATLKAAGINSADDYAAYHYKNHGKTEGRAITAMTGGDEISKFLESLPGYKFARDQGVKSIGNALGSRGQTGAQAKGIARFVTGLADQTYGEQVNRLAAAAGLGQNAAATTGQLSGQTANNVGQSLIGAGTASAAGTVGATNAIAGGISNLTNLYAANKILGPSGFGGGLTRI